PRALAPLEAGRALLEERPRTLLVVFALGRLDGQFLELLPPLVGETVQIRLDRHFRAAHRERRVITNLPEVLVGVALQVGGGHDPLDEAHGERLPALAGPPR